ncbi:MAG: immunity 26/phosphotriesterase HocA family protein [Acidiferrobacter sp.]
MPKKIKRTVGDVVTIAIGKGTLCFGRVLAEPLMAFYDLQAKRIPSIKEIIYSPILFKVWVMNHAVTSGRWHVIGSAPLDVTLWESVKFFKLDPLSKESYIYSNGEETPASLEECEGLERAAVWDPQHVEDRLRDYYAGVPNRWVESLKLK